MSEIVTKIQKTSVRTLHGMVQEMLLGVAQQDKDRNSLLHGLSKNADEILSRFVNHMNNEFDELMDKEVVKGSAVFNFETLSLVQEEELDVMVALEGMVNASRNEHLAIFISFNTRLSSMFPRKRIDESSNPLDPEQVATAFQEAMRPMGLDAHHSLTVYRAFNKSVLKNMDKVLAEANGILVESRVIPNLGMQGPGKSAPKVRSTPRADPNSTFGIVEEEQFGTDDDQPELFSMMQNLLHFDEPPKPAKPATPLAKPKNPSKTKPTFGGVDDVFGDNLVEMNDEDEDNPLLEDGQIGISSSTSESGEQQYMIPASMIPEGMLSSLTGKQSGAMQAFKPAEGQQVQMVDQVKLMEILTSIQETLSRQKPEHIAGSIDEVEKLNISESLGEMLKSSGSDDGVVNAVDRQSSDIINLVTLLYEAIWQDPSVPIPIKELIGRTQITIIKVALADVEFFNNETHPARGILNEFASAGIGWTEVEELEKDPMYRKMQEMVERILTEYKSDNEIFEDLIDDFRAFRAKEAAKTRFLEKRILKAKERKERLEDIHELVNQKIEERVLGRELDPFVVELLRGPFHKFMVMLVLKEGPGSSAWKQSINTIDVLLWTVQAHEHSGDRARLDTVNPRLLNNLRKAFRIASVNADEISELIDQLARVQEETFLNATVAEEELPEPDTDKAEEKARTEKTQQEAAKALAKAQAKEEKIVRFLTAAESNEPAKPKAEVIEPVPEESPDEIPITMEVSTADPEALSENDGAIKQVENLTVGVWVEFIGEENTNTRCKLAAKINAIDKYIFVNRQGVKVVEKTKMGLAKELKDGTVKIISDGLLFSRALESVIGNLRESKQEQQTSAYKPAPAAQ